MTDKILDKSIDVDKVLFDVVQCVRAIQSDLSLAYEVKDVTLSDMPDLSFVHDALNNSMFLVDYVDKLYHELVDFFFQLKGASDGKQ